MYIDTTCTSTYAPQHRVRYSQRCLQTQLIAQTVNMVHRGTATTLYGFGACIIPNSPSTLSTVSFSPGALSNLNRWTSRLMNRKSSIRAKDSPRQLLFPEI